jgi:hypothetical protein
MALLGGLGAGLALVPGPAGAEAPRQTASLTFTTATPGAPTGVNVAMDWTNPSDPSAKPYAVDKVVFRYAPGVAADYSVPAQCKASDAELEAQGAAACPAASRVAGGTVVTDSGASGGPFPRFVNVKADNFNNDHELIGVGDATNVPVIPGFTRTVTRSEIAPDGSFTTDFPDVPTGNPPDGYDALKSLRLSGPAIVRDGRAYLRAPATCPSTGFWTNSLTFIYHDGVQQTVDTHSPCHPGSAPRLAIHAEPRRRCAGRRFSIHVSLIDGNAVRSVVVRLDGRRLFTTTKKVFKLHAPVSHVRPGAHRLEVIASDAAGWTGVKSARVVRCGLSARG